MKNRMLLFIIITAFIGKALSIGESITSESHIKEMPNLRYKGYDDFNLLAFIVSNINSENNASMPILKRERVEHLCTDEYTHGENDFINASTINNDPVKVAWGTAMTHLSNHNALQLTHDEQDIIIAISESIERADDRSSSNDYTELKKQGYETISASQIIGVANALILNHPYDIDFAREN